MAPERWRLIEKVFYSAIKLDKSERRTGGLNHLLASEDDAGEFLEPPSVEAAGDDDAKLTQQISAEVVADVLTFSRAGKSRRGGMGVVYTAEDNLNHGRPHAGSQSGLITRWRSPVLDI